MGELVVWSRGVVVWSRELTSSTNRQSRLVDEVDWSSGMMAVCHAGDRGSIPGRGKYFLLQKLIGLTLVSSVSCVSSVQVLLLTNLGNKCHRSPSLKSI